MNMEMKQNNSKLFPWQVQALKFKCKRKKYEENMSPQKINKEVNKISTKKLQDSRRAKGLCYRCGKLEPTKRSSKCSACLDYYRKWRIAYRKAHPHAQRDYARKRRVELTKNTNMAIINEKIRIGILKEIEEGKNNV